jgi:hypothetical protein
MGYLTNRRIPALGEPFSHKGRVQYSRLREVTMKRLVPIFLVGFCIICLVEQKSQAASKSFCRNYCQPICERECSKAYDPEDDSNNYYACVGACNTVCVRRCSQ